MLKILDIKKYDVVNGPGIRCSIWLSGCSNHCKGCWSPHTWDANKGNEYKDNLIKIIEYVNNPKIDGISILGGDPFYWLFRNNKEAQEELKELLQICSDSGKPVWLWTGYTYELIKGFYPDYLSYIDVLIDGKFKEELKDLNLYWRGSSNQRVINVQESLKHNNIVLWDILV